MGENEEHAQSSLGLAADHIAPPAEGRLPVLRDLDETDLLATEYRAVLKQTDALRIYNRQITGLVESQDREMASFQRQIDDIELVAREIVPLMLEMISSLQAFVELDVPFLQEERSARIASLHDLMVRSDVTDAERFRRILEAYQIENEYGRTIEAYSGELKLDGKTRIVQFLRTGRTVLIYQTRDGSEAGVWDQDARAWKPVSGDYRSAIRQGLMIARKQADGLSRVPRAPEHSRGDFVVPFSLSLGFTRHFASYKYCTLQVDVRFQAQASCLLLDVPRTVKLPLPSCGRNPGSERWS